MSNKNDIDDKKCVICDCSRQKTFPPSNASMKQNNCLQINVFYSVLIHHCLSNLSKFFKTCRIVTKLIQRFFSFPFWKIAINSFKHRYR